MTVRISFPFAATFEYPDPGSNSRELRSQFLQNYLRQSGMETGRPIEDFQVTQFNGEESGEFWTVSTGTR